VVSPGHGCLSVLSVVCCQGEVSTKGRSLVQNLPTQCFVCKGDREVAIMGRFLPTMGFCAMGGGKNEDD
jgi:hypothetical protein